MELEDNGPGFEDVYGLLDQKAPFSLKMKKAIGNGGLFEPVY